MMLSNKEGSLFTFSYQPDLICSNTAPSSLLLYQANDEDAGIDGYEISVDWCTLWIGL